MFRIDGYLARWQVQVFLVIQVPVIALVLLKVVPRDWLAPLWGAGAVIAVLAVRVIPSWLWLNGIRPHWVVRWHEMKDEPIPEQPLSVRGVLLFLAFALAVGGAVGLFSAIGDWRSPPS